MRALLDAQFARLGLTDPDRRVRLAIAGYTLDAIVDGIAIFDGKRRAGTLPDGADARYLLGIVRNVQAQREIEHVADALLTLRLEARDQALAALVQERAVVCSQARADLEIIADCVDRALGNDRSLDRRFWGRARSGCDKRSISSSPRAGRRTPTRCGLRRDSHEGSSRSSSRASRRSSRPSIWLTHWWMRRALEWR